MRPYIVAITLVLIAIVFLVGGPAGAATGGGITTLVSVASDGTQANYEIDRPSISADGRYVAFASYANNLVAGDTNNSWDVFVHDRQTGETSRVSVASDGPQGNDYSVGPSISADGRYVAFASYADNLVAGDTNSEYDIFVHDRQAGETSRVSIASDGTQANGLSNQPTISANGQYVAFYSWASNLIVGDTGDYGDIFVHDRQTGETSRVVEMADGNLGRTSISADGRYVAFDAYNYNLVPGDTNFAVDVFVHDRQTGQTSRVSVASDGTQGNAHSSRGSISADGRYVAFQSQSDNFVLDDTNGTDDIFVHDRQMGETSRVSVASDGTQGTGGSAFPSLSANGRYVAFQSWANNLVADDTGAYADIFVHDRLTGETSRVSAASDGTEGNSDSSFPSISENALSVAVAFNSEASNLVPSDTNGYRDVFVHELDAPIAPTYTISGRITVGAGQPLAGVTVAYGSGTATTDGNGDYLIAGLAGGAYTIIPAKAGYTFSPGSRVVTAPPSATAVNFSGAEAAGQAYLPFVTR